MIKPLFCNIVQAHVASDIGIDQKHLSPKRINSQTYLDSISEWTETYMMKLNKEKTKYMIFNFTKKYQFSTRLTLNDEKLEQIEETMLLGSIISSNLKWHANTAMLIKKAYRRMSMLHNLGDFSLPISELLNIYIIFVRSSLEQSCVIWHSSITVGEILDIERVQKVALRVILGEKYQCYDNALKLTKLKTLEERHEELCLTFAEKCVKSGKNDDIFPLTKINVNQKDLRNRNVDKFEVLKKGKVRLLKSSIPYMQNLLNENFKK